MSELPVHQTGENQRLQPGGGALRYRAGGRILRMDYPRMYGAPFVTSRILSTEYNSVGQNCILLTELYSVGQNPILLDTPGNIKTFS